MKTKIDRLKLIIEEHPDIQQNDTSATNNTDNKKNQELRIPNTRQKDTSNTKSNEEDRFTNDLKSKLIHKIEELQIKLNNEIDYENMNVINTKFTDVMKDTKDFREKIQSMYIPTPLKGAVYNPSALPESNNILNKLKTFLSRSMSILRIPGNKTKKTSAGNKTLKRYKPRKM